MATEVVGIHLIESRAPIEVDRTRASPRAAPAKLASLLIATRHEIAGAGIEALLQAGGHSVVARCSNGDDLLRFSEVYRLDIIMLAENIVGQDAAKTILRLRARSCSLAILFLLEAR